MRRIELIERLRRQVANVFPSDDFTITNNLVNSWLGDAIAAAAKASYTESIRMDGVAYLNNGFYTTFSGIAVSKDTTDDFQYTLQLPQLPVGIGANEGIASLKFKKSGQTSYDAVPLTINQVGISQGSRKIQNKIIYYQEGRDLKVRSTVILSAYTATVRMVSGGISSDLNSEINVPQEWFPMMVEYISKALRIENAQKADVANDGQNQP